MSNDTNIAGRVQKELVKGVDKPGYHKEDVSKYNFSKRSGFVIASVFL